MANYEQPDAPTEQNQEDKPEEFEKLLVQWVSGDGTTPGEDLPNLVPFFIQSDEGKKWLGDVCAAQACNDTKQGWDESEEYRTHRNVVNRLYTGFLKKKVFPYDGCANAHVPIVLEKIQRVAANVWAEIFGQDMVFGVEATGPDDYEIAEALTVHANWRMKHELTDFHGQMDKAVVEFFLAGSVFSHSWRDTKANRNRHDILSCDEFVVPYAYRTDQVDLSDVPWKTRIVRKYRHELEDLRDSKEWAQVDAVLAKNPPPHDFLEQKNREQGEQREGIHAGESSKSRPYLFYEYHGWMRMPGETSQRPICAIVSADEKIVVRLYIREEEDYEDRQRYDRETNELGKFQEDVATFPQRQQEFEADSAMHAKMMSQGHMMPDGSMMPGPPMMDPMGQPLPPPPQPEPPIPPSPPAWAQLDEATGGYLPPKPVRRIPIEMFAHGRCMHSPDGMLGLGMGHVLAPFNKVSDEALNRFFDQATANNSPHLLTTGKFLQGNKALVPNAVSQVDSTVDDIRKTVMELRPGAANPQLLDIVRYNDEASDAAVAAPGVLSGQPGKSGETFRGLATRAEKAAKQLTTSGVKFIQFVDQILKNDAKLQATFLEDEQFIQVNNHLGEFRKFLLEDGPPDPETGQPMGKVPQRTIRIARDMYRRKFDVTFTADVRFTSQAEKVAEIDEALAMVNAVIPAPPPELGMPDNFAAIRHALVSKALRLRGQRDLIPLLGPPPPAPPMPMGTPIMPPPPPMMPPGAPGAGPPPPGGPPPDAPQPGATPS